MADGSRQSKLAAAKKKVRAEGRAGTALEARSGAERLGSARPGPVPQRSAAPGGGGGPWGPGLRCCAACVPCLPLPFPFGFLFHISIFPSSFFFLLLISFPLSVPFFPSRGAARPAPSRRDALLCQSQTNGKVPWSSSGFHFEILPRILFVPVLFTLTWKRSPASMAALGAAGTSGASEPRAAQSLAKTAFKSASVADCCSPRPAVVAAPVSVRYLEGCSPSSVLSMFLLHLITRRGFSSLHCVLLSFIPYCC